MDDLTYYLVIVGALAGLVAGAAVGSNVHRNMTLISLTVIVLIVGPAIVSSLGFERTLLVAGLPFTASAVYAHRYASRGT